MQFKFFQFSFYGIEQNVANPEKWEKIQHFATLIITNTAYHSKVMKASKSIVIN